MTLGLVAYRRNSDVYVNNEPRGILSFFSIFLKRFYGVIMRLGLQAPQMYFQDVHVKNGSRVCVVGGGGGGGGGHNFWALFTQGQKKVI